MDVCVGILESDHMWERKKSTLKMRGTAAQMSENGKET